jgi:hypothetical protein
MNKNRLNRLEKSIGKQLQEEGGAPAIWSPKEVGWPYRKVIGGYSIT